ncbi:MAG: TrkA family potassium uptake protein [Oscillospiraceae bacterium]|nr:TrkA family potassium uptake protein [Oscillospiraceae bacterium]
MKSILLIGVGRFGKHVAQRLNELGHEVMAVDRKEERIQSVMPYVTSALIGDTTNPDFLDSIGVDNFDLCIVGVGSDFQSSLETTSLLKELGAKMVVSRASRDVHAKFLLRNGADEVVYPEKQLAGWTAIRYSADHILDYIELDDEHSIIEVTVPEAWVGKTVGEINIRRKYNINILALKDNGKLNASINADTLFTAEQTLLVLGSYRDLQKCFHT